MSNQVFGPKAGPAPNFLRNAYDKQFQNLITTDFGEIRPCFVKEVLPGDSVLIDPVAAIRSQPIVFPIQTRLKFYCHFFYGRNRTLMDDWEDFIFKTKDGIVKPWVRLNNSRAKQMISTNSLGDNLGVPSTFVSGNDIVLTSSVSYRYYGWLIHNSLAPTLTSVNSWLSSQNYFLGRAVGDASSYSFGSGYCFEVNDVPSSRRFTSSPFRTSASVTPDVSAYVMLSDYVGDTSSNTPNRSLLYSLDLHCSIVDGYATLYFDLPVRLFEQLQSHDYSVSSLYVNIISLESELDDSYYVPSNPAPYFDVDAPSSDSLIPSEFTFVHVFSGITDATDDSVIAYNKFVGDTPDIPLDALPFRLYEFICNYYYRNDQNNPYILNGEVQYNKFLPTTATGADDNLYVLHHRNWESDAFTTAVPSPQFGVAPLVGLTYSGGDTAVVKANVTDSDGNTKELGITVGVDGDGNITSILQPDDGVPSGTLRKLMDNISLGISINDLRNVNSFQRFLENTLRRGLRYRNQLLSHFGVSVDYPDIDIPQFIGGFSGDLTIREVTNMAESSDIALGDVAGKIDAVISSNHSISCYCPEHGFIMGLFMIVPVPTYSQLLPTYFTRYDAFDYFQKEFDKIGYVPIFHRNFMPLQSNNPDAVLGYQRAFWDYMASVDEVHGDFRDTLSDFVLYRVFSGVPTLNEEFLKVDADSLNNIFAVDKVEDKYRNASKFMCQFYFQYSHKTMISKYGVASLE